jgi:hypothetical protein
MLRPVTMTVSTKKGKMEAPRSREKGGAGKEVRI